MNTNDKLRSRVANFLMILLIINTLGMLAAVFLNGLGLLNVDKTVLLSLIGETMAHAAAMFLSVTRNLFP